MVTDPQKNADPDSTSCDTVQIRIQAKRLNEYMALHFTKIGQDILDLQYSLILPDSDQSSMSMSDSNPVLRAENHEDPIESGPQRCLYYILKKSPVTLNWLNAWYLY